VIAIHEPDVVFTDLGLAALGAYLGWRLAKSPGRGRLTRYGTVVMGGLASAALWGAAFHAFFPAKTATVAGFIAWLPVALSILVVASALLDLGLSLLAPGLPPRVRHALVEVYAVSFAAVVLLVDESFSSIVRFYAPTLLLMLVAAVVQVVRSRDTGWTLIAAGFAVSVGAVVLQQARVAIHPTYFDHNAVYHALQGVALVLFYRGFTRAAFPDAPASAHAR
jgi:hypothetical protein